MRDAVLLGTRLVLGGYLAVHGAQKLFGAFDGPGLDAAGAGFESIGLTPGRQMAALAGVTELAGGVLTGAGAADPLGPLAIAGAMSVAAAPHRATGPLAANRGFELPLTNLAAAAALAAVGPGRFRLTPPVPRALAALAAVTGGALAAGSLAKLFTAKPAASQPAAATESTNGAAAERSSVADGSREPRGSS
jgi:putative oxidoreductase